MSKLGYNPHQPTLPLDEGWSSRERRGYARPRRDRNFADPPDAEESLSVLRGALAKALDDDFERGALGIVLWQRDAHLPHVKKFIRELVELVRDNDKAGILELLADWGNDVFQAIAVCLLPEVYAGPDPWASGMVKRAGIERVGEARLEVGVEKLAKKIKSRRERGKG